VNSRNKLSKVWKNSPLHSRISAKELRLEEVPLMPITILKKNQRASIVGHEVDPRTDNSVKAKQRKALRAAKRSRSMPEVVVMEWTHILRVTRLWMIKGLCSKKETVLLTWMEKEKAIMAWMTTLITVSRKRETTRTTRTLMGMISCSKNVMHSDHLLWAKTKTRIKRIWKGIRGVWEVQEMNLILKISKPSKYLVRKSGRIKDQIRRIKTKALWEMDQRKEMIPKRKILVVKLISKEEIQEVIIWTQVMLTN